MESGIVLLFYHAFPSYFDCPHNVTALTWEKWRSGGNVIISIRPSLISICASRSLLCQSIIIIHLWVSFCYLYSIGSWSHLYFLRSSFDSCRVCDGTILSRGSVTDMKYLSRPVNVSRSHCGLLRSILSLLIIRCAIWKKMINNYDKWLIFLITKF